ncbi:metallophosphoesterase family protein [Lentibacillus sp. JNUCC-1]|uniref:metallophosphoesterase family protein n=1 Tax=Lentibacillus sp. JNUCC-1 TaxID=2654513 RepID=UPI0012E79484|nr:metallophosphoesterase family protein [Lentibacillus sp. JNUCC-1]
MHIVILSDTHMPKAAQKLPKQLIEALKSADHIIHAGDWSTMDVYETLKNYAPVTGVYGNNDNDDIRAVFSDRAVVEFSGFPKIGVVHGHGTGKTTEKRAAEAFLNEETPPDIIVFGHSHIPFLRYMKKQLMVNPGSPTDKRTQPYYSFAVLKMGETVDIKHVFFK